MVSPEPREAACPHLSSFRDVTTFYAYPSAANGCGRAAPPAPLPGSHQARFCLTARHTECPLNAPSWSGTFPPEVRAAAEREWGRRRPRSMRRRLLWVILSIVFVGAIAVAGWALSDSIPAATAGPGGQAQAVAPSREPAGIPSRTPSASPSPSPTAPPTLAPSDTPAPLFTATPGPALETPIGLAPTYLIHSIQTGESLSSLAQAYITSPQAIQAANRLEGLPLWVGQLVVVPVGINDPTGVPGFAVVQVAEPGETLSDVAARFAADPESIRRYNALSEDPWLPAGRWLIVPLP